MNEDACYAEQMNKAARKMYIIYFGFWSSTQYTRKHIKSRVNLFKSLSVCLCTQMHVQVNGKRTQISTFTPIHLSLFRS